MAAQIASQELPLRNGCRTPKTTTFAIPRVIVLRMSMKDYIFESIPVDNEDSFEGGGGVRV